MLGYYGEIAGPVDPNLYDRITAGAEPVTDRPGSLKSSDIERARRERGPFASDEELLLAIFYDDRELDALKRAGPIDTDYPLEDTPLLTLVRELAKRRDLRSVRLSGK